MLSYNRAWCIVSFLISICYVVLIIVSSETIFLIAFPLLLFIKFFEYVSHLFNKAASSWRQPDCLGLFIPPQLCDLGKAPSPS